MKVSYSIHKPSKELESIAKSFLNVSSDWTLESTIFSQRVIEDWNSLSEDVISSDSINQFKNRLFKIQETLFEVDISVYNIITLAKGYFVDKHDMKNCTCIQILTKITG